MYEKVATVTLSIEETVSLGQGERGPDRDSYFPNPVSQLPMSHTLPTYFRENGFGGQLFSRH